MKNIRLFCGAIVLMIVLPAFTAIFAHAQPMRPPEISAPDAKQIGAEPGYLGMVADDRQESGQGIRVKDVDPDSPAAKGGLQADDLITAINGQQAHSLEDMKNILGAQAAGTPVNFQVQRQGATQNVNVTLGRRPPPDQRRFQSFGRIPDAPVGQEGQPMGGQPPGASASNSGQSWPAGGMSGSRLGLGASGPPPLLGIRTLPVTQQDQLRLGLSSTAGAHVMSRTLGSPAEKANIPLDAVIMAVNGAPVGTPNDLTALLARAGAGSEVELTYMYNGKPVSTKVTLASGSVGTEMNGWQQQGQSPLPQPPMPMLGQQRQYGSQSGSVDIGHQGNVPPRSSDTQQQSFDGQQRPGDAQRIEALERRVQELEQKVQELQQRLQQQENGPPRGT
ncbi:MAG TPA: PDZ domain-containing protein [Pirellulales bacterium]|jgi:membrane-associated protease RseP (regulator of RpoE activity)|nr:PDZ domain-containing protein [Pirellulales bacterium]